MTNGGGGQKFRKIGDVFYERPQLTFDLGNSTITASTTDKMTLGLARPSNNHWSNMFTCPVSTIFG